MSPRAAWRLEAFGFRPVYDYVAGKADWLASGLPTEGRLQHAPRVASVLDTSVATCVLGERVRDIIARLDRVSSGVCVVVNNQRVIQGRLRLDRLDPSDERAVEQVMEPGPATIRADAALAETVGRMKKRNVRSLIVSTPEGVLLGVLRADPSRMPSTPTSS